MSRVAARHLRDDHGVTNVEYRLLALVHESSDAITLNRLARTAGLAPAQTSRAIARLVGRGLVERGSGPSRSTPLTLTRQGERVTRELLEFGATRDDALRHHLGEHDARALESLLSRLEQFARDR